MKPAFAVVIWEDAMMAGHWQEGQVPEIEGPCLVYSIGWITYSGKDKIILCQSLTDGAHGNALTIPRGMVRAMSKAVLE